MIKIIREDCYATVEAFQNAIQPFMEAGWILCPYVGGMLAFETAADYKAYKDSITDWSVYGFKGIAA